MAQLTLIEFDKWCREFLDQNFDKKDAIDDSQKLASKDVFIGGGGDEKEIIVTVSADFKAATKSSTMPLLQMPGEDPTSKTPAIDISAVTPKTVIIEKYQAFFEKLPELRITKTDIQAVVRFLASRPKASHFAQDLARVNTIVCKAAKIPLQELKLGEDVKVIDGPLKGAGGRVILFDPNRIKTTIRIQLPNASKADVDITEIERDMSLYLSVQGTYAGESIQDRDSITNISLGYSSEFIARGIFEDFLASYAGIPGYEDYGQNKSSKKIEEGRGAFTSLAYMLGHELMHFRYAHHTTTVNKAMKDVVMPRILADYQNPISTHIWKSKAIPRVRDFEEIQNNTYMSNILDIPVVDSAVGPQVSFGKGIWGFGWISLMDVKPVKVKPGIPQEVEALLKGKDSTDPVALLAKLGIDVDPNMDPAQVKDALDRLQKKYSQEIQAWELRFRAKRRNLEGIKDFQAAKEWVTDITHPKDQKRVKVDSVAIAPYPLSRRSVEDLAIIYAAALGLFEKMPEEDAVGIHPPQEPGDKPDFPPDDIEQPPDDDDGGGGGLPPINDEPQPQGYQPGMIVRVNRNVKIPGRDPAARRDGIVMEATGNPDRTQTVKIRIDDGDVMQACKHKNPTRDPNPVTCLLSSNDITISPNQPPKPKKPGEGQQLKRGKWRQGQLVRNEKTGDVAVIVGVAFDKEGKPVLNVDKDPAVVKAAQVAEGRQPSANSLLTLIAEVAHGSVR